MKRAGLIVLLATLGGCASQPCTLDSSDAACRTERLLFQNDLMQAKILASLGDEEGYELASALLERSARLDQRGETEFYRAILLIRQAAPTADVQSLLEQAADKGHPHATALLYKMHAQPYLLEEADPQQADHYRQAYSQLDVARSGYPSFEKALELVSQLVQPPPRPDSGAPALCLQYCQSDTPTP
ncbi:hypothetical protein HW090_04105 [Pseudomonas sp. ABC1]|uniref:hypothetical protein n=1 Tax=Pseudomonas sp. ABC1 TaxID=2748080 RepID=UPI0015C3B9A5|nr:hypothetical protein [Pseudomonas sp. ABC1]QLF92423.1 hypothetical protein HW090_04105 [Pseudomonas sp. ABC1]